MTTKINIACEAGSHWAVKVTVMDMQIDTNTNSMVNCHAGSYVLQPGEKKEEYVHSTRFYIIEEGAKIEVPEVPPVVGLGLSPVEKPLSEQVDEIETTTVHSE